MALDSKHPFVDQKKIVNIPLEPHETFDQKKKPHQTIAGVNK